MATNILLPQWGMNMKEGTVVRWLKKEGDSVNLGEPLAEIETTKIDSELEAPAAGVVAHIVVPEGATVPVGALLLVLGAPGEQVPKPAPPQLAAPVAAPSRTPSPRPSSTPVTVAAGSPGAPAVLPQVTPVARRLAQEHGINLQRVRGTGPNGRISEADVRQAIERQAQAGPVTVVPLRGIRRTIAERMVLSLQTMAQVTLLTEADVTTMMELKRGLLASWRPHRLRPMDQDLIVAATVKTLKSHPRLNAVMEGDEIRQLGEVNIGVAMALPDGVIVPVLRRAGEKGILAIAQELRVLAEKARDGKLTVDDISDGTFTITSLASLDVDGFTPIINPPEVAILGVGRVVEKPAVYNGEIAKRSMMALSLTFDHRALDGAPAAQFLQAVRRSLEEPQWMAT